MYRLLHTADWHLGHSLHGLDREAEHSQALDAILAIIERERVDAVIVSGDIYHVANPPVSAQKAFFEFIRAMSGRAPATELIVIAGNHDSGARLELPLSLGVGERARILGAPPRSREGPDPAAAVLGLRDSAGAARAALVALPYPRPGDLFGFDETEGHLQSSRPVREYLVRAAAAAQAAYPDLPLIVAGHLHVQGGQVSRDSERAILIGGEEAIPLSDFPEAADYVALGHLHRPQTLRGRPLAAYSGSPIPLSMDEAAYAQSVALVSFDTSGPGRAKVEIERIALPRARGFLRVPKKGAAALDTVEKELEALAARLADDADAAERPPFLEVAVALDAPEPDLRRRVEAALGDAPARLVRIRRESPGRNSGGEAAESAPAPAPPTPEEAFALLYEARHDGAPPADLAAAFRQLASAVANTDEEPAADSGARS